MTDKARDTEADLVQAIAYALARSKRLKKAKGIDELRAVAAEVTGENIVRHVGWTSTQMTAR